jgi:hypothetical protein
VLLASVLQFVKREAQWAIDFERSETGGLGACPHKERNEVKVNDAPLALRGPLPWRPSLLGKIIVGYLRLCWQAVAMGRTFLLFLIHFFCRSLTSHPSILWIKEINVCPILYIES